MVIPRTYIETEIPHTRKGWRVTVHSRPRKSLFPRPKARYFPTYEEARAWAGELWLAGNADRRRTRLGFASRLSTRTVLWVRPDLIPTGPYADLPEVRAVRHATGLTVWLAGTLLVADCGSRKTLKRAILDHPLGEHLCVKPCSRCGRMPRIDLAAGTLTHRREDCDMRIHMPYDLLTPTPLQIALWNRFFSRRRKATKLDPVTRPIYMMLGALREPSERDMMRRIRAIEVIQ